MEEQPFTLCLSFYQVYTILFTVKVWNRAWTSWALSLHSRHHCHLFVSMPHLPGMCGIVIYFAWRIICRPPAFVIQVSSLFWYLARQDHLSSDLPSCSSVWCPTSDSWLVAALPQRRNGEAAPSIASHYLYWRILVVRYSQGINGIFGENVVCLETAFELWGCKTHEPAWITEAL